MSLSGQSRDRSSGSARSSHGGLRTGDARQRSRPPNRMYNEHDPRILLQELGPSRYGLPGGILAFIHECFQSFFLFHNYEAVILL